MPAKPKLTEENLREILIYKRNGMPNTHIAKIFEVSEAAIRKRLKAIKKEYKIKKFQLKNRVFEDDIIKEIRDLYSTQSFTSEFMRK